MKSYIQMNIKLEGFYWISVVQDRDEGRALNMGTALKIWAS
jgi:hypothetical protein